MTGSDKILLTVEDAVATITLNRPAKLNAFDREMLAALERAAALVDASTEIRVVVLNSAAEKAFCAGADIEAWSALGALGMWRDWIREGHRAFDRIARLRQPVVAALHGIAYGGGLELALAADLRVAAEGTRLALPEVTIAAVPGWGGTQRLGRLIGLPRAKQMVLTGSPIDAATALAWGLVNDVVPATDLESHARALAQRIAANAPVSVQTAKQMLDAADGGGLAVALEGIAGALAASTSDAAEGVAAFRQRRPAQFTGN
jgi:enoyl-CoA hydratase